MLQTIVTIAWKYINKYTQFPCYRFLPLSNWSFFLLQKSTKKERDTFSSSCEINVVVLYMFLLLFPVLFGRHIYWSPTALKIDRFLDPRLVVFASLLHYLTVLLYLKCITRCIFSCIIIILRWRIWSLILLKGDPKVCSPSSVWQISRVSPVLLPKTNRIVLCQRRGQV